MASIYTDFLTHPDAAVLAEDASLSYITTTTTLTEPAAIVKHLQAQSKKVTRADKVLNIIESSNGACVETETTMKFVSGGGAYLPGIDDNFINDRSIVVPMVHIVTFNDQQKISQIRIYWEQGTLLRQVEVIGRTGKNWPIREGKQLVDAVTKSISSNTKQAQVTSSKSQNPATNISATRDPHASLQLFSPREEEQRGEYVGSKVAPRASARPPPRDYNELFAERGEESPSVKRSTSPSKIDGRSVKAHANKKFVENRLFDENAPYEPQSPEKKKTFNQKYNHFDFGADEVNKDDRPVSKSSKGTSHFSFEDFTAVPQHHEKSRPDQVRNWGAEDSQFQAPQESREVVHRARPDSKPHFQLTDQQTNTPVSKPRTTTNVDAARRGQDFGAHYEIADKAHVTAPTPKPKGTARAELQPSWGFSEQTPEKKIYKTAGNGMGGRGARAWSIGDQEEPEKQKQAFNNDFSASIVEKKIYKTAGNGMGGRGQASWSIGDEGDDYDTRSRRTQQSQANAGADK